jgi:thioredoxin 1
MSHITEATDTNFQEEVLNSELPVLVDFWAPWCGPCRMVAPVIESMAEKMNSSVKFVKLNTDENMKIAQDYGIRGIPTLLIFKGGKEADRIVGFRSREELENQLNKHIS